MPAWARWVLVVLVALVVLYLIGFVVFGCGTETGTGVGETTGARG
jgi:hypothetical protein